MTKPTLCYEIRVVDANANDRYGRTYLILSLREPESVVRNIANCVEDSDYYGQPERWEALARLGHEVAFPYGSCAVTVQWQHFTDKFHNVGQESYCSHRIEDLDSLATMQWATKLLTRIARNAAKSKDCCYGPSASYSHWLDCPDTVVAALDAMKAQRVEHVADSIVSTCVKATSDLPDWRGADSEAA